MDQVAAKKALQELVKQEELKNKVCCDCTNPNPQWASLSFAIFLCLQCAGTHRGFGVHISFVRSVSMDTWQEEQIKRMKLGGNAPFREFITSYTPAEQGGYKDGLSPYDIYHSWAATQYREKLDATLAGNPWSQSAPPEGYKSPGSGTASPGRPSSAQGLRKSRTSARSATGSTLRSDSASPASFTSSSHGTPDLPQDQKAANESFFASLGQANASRPADLPPSEGGRYQGFGNTPSPQPSQHPSLGLSSAAAPSLSDLQENPMAALSKGWSLFSAAVAGASRAVSENVIQPGMEKVRDPELQASVKGYMSGAQKRAGEAARSANNWSKSQFGVDVGEQVGGVVGVVKDTVGRGPAASGYGALPMEHGTETSALYHDEEEDFFGEYDQAAPGQSKLYDQPIERSTNIDSSPTKKEDWDKWDDF